MAIFYLPVFAMPISDIHGDGKAVALAFARAGKVTKFDFLKSQTSVSLVS
jgi:hypothetical protein